MKVCNHCKKEKPDKEFKIRKWKNQHGYGIGLTSYCNNCTSYLRKTRFAENKKRKKKTYQQWQKSLKGKWSNYKRTSRINNRLFKLTFNEFCSLCCQPCYYCGKLQNPFNGIDRVNSSKGYVLDNCVPCCTKCNRMKLNITEEDFIKQCKLITNKKEVMNYA